MSRWDGLSDAQQQVLITLGPYSSCGAGVRTSMARRTVQPRVAKQLWAVGLVDVVSVSRYALSQMGREVLESRHEPPKKYYGWS